VGQKVHPYGFRLGFNKTWKSRWFADKDYATLLHEDLALKRDLKKRFQHAGVAKVEIERAANKLKIDIHTSRPGIIIGRKGQEVDKLKQEIQKRTNREVFINIQEIQKPELDAQLIGESVAMQLEKRVAFRRAMRKAVESALRFGARGIKVRVSGRLNGAEIARSEWYLHGQLPLQTLRADIDYGFAEANTTYGQIGVKVWLYKGERLTPKVGREEEYGGRVDRGDRDRGPRRDRPRGEMR
jgi:small subunit ribosomal protein S3